MAKSIGIFDSGIGGLTVVREVINILPNESIVYFGDTARVPYGNKSTQTIKRFASQIVQFLLSKNVKLIVVACNTVSATSLDWLKKEYKLPIIGVIEPGVNQAILTTRNGKIGVIGTNATIESKAYEFAIHKINKKFKVYSKSCPLLVPLAEEGWNNPELKDIILNHYFSGLKKRSVDTLILGCTHYPLLKSDIQRVMGPEIKLIDSATSVALKVKEILKDRGVLQYAPTLPHHSFYFSDIPRGFRQLSKRFIGYPISCTQITLGVM